MPDTKHKRSKFAKLQQKYTRQLPDKIEKIHRYWSAFVDRNGEPATNFSELKQLIHGLAGSAGTFHFNRLSEEARAAEQLLANIEKILPSDGQLAAIDKILHRLDILAGKGPESIIPMQMPETEAHATKPDHFIYVVEDDQILAAEIARQLEYFGYQTKVFHDYTRALEAMRQKSPTAMIIDVQLPEGKLAGTELAQNFHAFSTQRVPLIFISVRDDWEARLAAVRSGGQSYLVKPLDFSKLLDRLDLLTGSDERDPYRVMIVDDMEILAEHYALVLESAGMQVKVVNKPNNLFNPLRDFRPELILMDLNMPGCSGIEAAGVIRQKEDFIGIPIVYLSTETNPERQLSAMRLGGDDFLHKPIRDEDLIDAVAMRTERFRKIRSLMNRDSLTGLLNHATVKTCLDSESELACRNKSTLSLAMIDIDHFKLVNDTYGHPMGDRVIKTIARLLSQRLRKSDIIGRYGGEEFVAVFPDTPVDTAVELVDGLRKQFANIVHVHQDIRFFCTFSAGISALPPCKTVAELIGAADKALYRSKHGGRNQVNVA